ncbi:hypothetical protein HY992_01140 [Candidatus Micrarchaeota archaeon]|nr:hypothetical protein [Candidatus Micrarchaeota archaeon]
MSQAQQSSAPTRAQAHSAPRLPMPLKHEGLAGFRRWRDLFFINAGLFKITDKCFKSLLPEFARQAAVAPGELAEMVCDRRKEDVITLTLPTVGSTAKSLVHAKALEKISDGTIGEWYDAGFIQPVVKWKRVDRGAITRKFVECLGKQVTAVSSDDLRLNGLGTMLPYCPHPLGLKHSHFFALVEAGLAHSIKATLEHASSGEFDASKPYFFQMNDVPKIYHVKACRVAAVKWLLNELKNSTPSKNATELSQDDFHERGWAGLVKHYACNLFEALVEAQRGWPLDETLEHSAAGKFSDEKLYFWQMKRSSRLYSEQKYRIAVTRWVVSKTGKLENVIVDSFQNLGVAGLLVHTQHSLYLALVEAGFAHSLEETLDHARTGKFDGSKVYPWQMARVPTSFDYSNGEHRAAAYTWLAWKASKPVDAITKQDFLDHGLAGLYAHKGFETTCIDDFRSLAAT